jgi:hypothetical protein
MEQTVVVHVIPATQLIDVAYVLPRLRIWRKTVEVDGEAVYFLEKRGYATMTHYPGKPGT